jgi:hypothetical protein
MRFARLQKNSDGDVSVKPGGTNRLILVAYNVAWWIPILLAFTKIIDYRAGFIAFALITLFRAGANVYRNNILGPELAVTFPLRAP